MRPGDDGRGGAAPAAPAPGLRAILSDPAVRSVIGVVFVLMLGFGIVVPVLPLYARSFGVGYGEAALLISGFALARLAADPAAGPVVDRVGERKATVSGVLVVAVSSLLAGLAPTFPLAVAARALGGVGSALMFAAVTSYLLKAVPKDRMARTLGLFYGSFNLGAIAGGPIGGLVAEHLGLASPLFVYAALLVVGGALFLRFVRDPDPGRAGRAGGDDLVGPPAGTPAPGATREAGRVHDELRSLFARRAFLTAVVANFAYLWTIAAVFDTLVPLFGKDRLGMSAFGIGTVFAAALAAELAVLYPAGSAADRRGRVVVLVPSLAALAVTIGLLGLAGSAVALGVMMAVLGVASGFAGIPPAAMLSDVAPAERSGTAVGIFRFAGDLGFVLGPLVAGFSATSWGFASAFWIAATPIVAALLLAVRTPESLGAGPAAAAPHRMEP